MGSCAFCCGDTFPIAQANVGAGGLTGRPDATRTAALGLVHCLGFGERLAAFAAADVLVLCLPLTAGTRGIVDSAAFAALPDGACLVNVARGGLVEYAAARASFSGGRLRGARRSGRVSAHGGGSPYHVWRRRVRLV